MRVATYRGNSFHAPENSNFALVSAYTSGADVLEFDVQPTQDDQLVVVAPGPLSRLTDSNNTVSELTKDELNALDLGGKFAVRGSTDLTWKRDLPHVRAETLGGLLDKLPADAAKVAQVYLKSGVQPGPVVKKVVDAFKRRGALTGVWIASIEPNVLTAAEAESSDIITALVTPGGSVPGDVTQWASQGPKALILTMDAILDTGNQPTPLASAIQTQYAAGSFPEGVIVRPKESTGTFTREQFVALNDLQFVFAVSTSSGPDIAEFVHAWRKLTDESFAGNEESSNIRFGYAKANHYAHVYQDDGVHIKISPYPEPPSVSSPPAHDPVAQKLEDLTEGIWDAARDWPFYSGGGLGTVLGITGDFIAEVDFSMETTSQATMCEMAATNVDPGKHMPGWITGAHGQPIANVPRSFRDKNCFFDPHGAPPFVGVEHDEDDGYRINHNLGTQYDNNQYGRPHGDGTTKKGRFRLERRGPFFAAYYKDTKNADWVLCGVCRNDSMNERVFIRCSGKRWRQEDDSGAAGAYFPIPTNHFVFKDFVVKTKVQ